MHVNVVFYLMDFCCPEVCKDLSPLNVRKRDCVSLKELNTDSFYNIQFIKFN